MFESLNRFAGKQPLIDRHLDELYGTEEWRPIAADRNPEQRRRGLIDLYRRQLMNAGFPLVTNFEMVDRGNRTEYFLYFGTTSTKGLSAMKRAMWKADPAGGRAFSDHIALNLQLFLVPATAPIQSLRDVLLHQFKRRCVSIEVIVDFVLRETIFSESSHLKRRTLLPLEREELIAVQRPGAGGKMGHYPAGTMITFKT